MSWATGKTVLVTGGTQGIGYATAKAFQALGAKVIISGTRGSSEDYDDDLSGLHYVKANMADKAAIEALANETKRLDVLVNNAGMGRPDEYTTEGFEKVIDVNLNGVMALSLACHEKLKESGGAVVNVGSLSSFLALREAPAYTASKAAVLGLTRALADKWAPDGIRVNMVAPGFIETRMTAPQRAHEKLAKGLTNAIPMRRFGVPAEVAECITFLASPAASYVTGQSLAMDGGLMLR